METKHTKGEWTIYSPKHTVKLYSYIYAGDVRIAEIKSFGKNEHFNDATFEEKEANAKLISAAPDMLEALIELQNDIESWNNLFESDRIRITNAITKATK